MLEKWRGVIVRVDATLRRDITRYMVERGLMRGDVPGDSFYDCLERARLMQADVVLAALRLNSRRSLRLAERLVGRPITVCPPMLAMCKIPRMPKSQRRVGDERLVLRTRKPKRSDARSKRRLLDSPVYQRIALIQEGMSVGACLARGVRRKDFRIAIRRGYVEVQP